MKLTAFITMNIALNTRLDEYSCYRHNRMGKWDQKMSAWVRQWVSWEKLDNLTLLSPVSGFHSARDHLFSDAPIAVRLSPRPMKYDNIKPICAWHSQICTLRVHCRLFGSPGLALVNFQPLSVSRT